MCDLIVEEERKRERAKDDSNVVTGMNNGIASFINSTAIPYFVFSKHI
jgi:hypothetical protein